MDLQPIACAHADFVRERSGESIRQDRISVEPTVQDVLCGRGKVRGCVCMAFWGMLNR